MEPPEDPSGGFFIWLVCWSFSAEEGGTLVPVTRDT